MWTYKCDRCGAALDPGERCDCQDRPAKYNGKPIFTQENFNYSEAKIGDYVEQAVVDDAMDCLPPASMSARCAQMGEPYSQRTAKRQPRSRHSSRTARKRTWSLSTIPRKRLRSAMTVCGTTATPTSSRTSTICGEARP